MGAHDERDPRPRGRRGSSSRSARLTRSADFDRVYRQGRSRANRHLVVYSFPRSSVEGPPRLGVSVGRKVGGAVERNRVKRLLREAFRAAAGELPEDHDFVVVARPAAGGLAREQGQPGIERALRELIEDSGLAAEARQS